MAYIMQLLSGIISIYILLVFIRLLLTWFPGADFGRPYAFLCAISDPYLNWFRRFRIKGPIDFSPLIALAVLSLIRGIFSAWGNMGRISIAAVLGMILAALWSIISWVLGFFVVILIIRMIAYLSNANIYSPFWRFVDFIAQPVLYRISRFFFPRRIVNYLFRIFFSIVILLLLAVLIRVSFNILDILLRTLPF
ncbi:hypothetical protein AGMMS50230_02300 [Spirochaetia bacterium]|nr:hypothetical protein AGMMS50230_02300 [Spirochaetia bacterium]